MACLCPPTPAALAPEGYACYFSLCPQYTRALATPTAPASGLCKRPAGVVSKGRASLLCTAPSPFTAAGSERSLARSHGQCLQTRSESLSLPGRPSKHLITPTLSTWNVSCGPSRLWGLWLKFPRAFLFNILLHLKEKWLKLQDCLVLSCVSRVQTVPGTE